MSKPKILIVEDSSIVAMSIQQRLEKFDYTVPAIVATGEGALEKAPEINPDVILMDIKLKGDIDGIETARRIRKRIDIPIVYLTAYSGEEVLQRAKLTMPYGYLIKPFTDRDLHIVIEMALYRHNSEKDRSKLQEQLIQSEKMASLGRFMAALTHELNTPIGIGVTAASTFERLTKKTVSSFEDNSLTKSALEKYFSNIKETSSILLQNLNHASDLIRSFKTVSVDQANVEKRKFKVKTYLEDILLTLKPKLKKTAHHVEINCSEQIDFEGYAGAFSQVITNLLMNSLIHGYERSDKGNIRIDVSVSENKLIMKYSDNGKGIPAENLKLIFEPFFTTKKEKGGTGLGLNVVYNIIHETFKGEILCESTVGEGTTFIITIPLEI